MDKHSKTLSIITKHLSEFDCKLLVFGSVANGRYSRSSDIDILVILKNIQSITKFMDRVNILLDNGQNPHTLTSADLESVEAGIVDFFRYKIKIDNTKVSFHFIPLEKLKMATNINTVRLINSYKSTNYLLEDNKSKVIKQGNVLKRKELVNSVNGFIYEFNRDIMPVDDYRVDITSWGDLELNDGKDFVLSFANLKFLSGVEIDNKDKFKQVVHKKKIDTIGCINKYAFCVDPNCLTEKILKLVLLDKGNKLANQSANRKYTKNIRDLSELFYKKYYHQKI